MKKTVLVLWFSLSCFSIQAQPNCNYFLISGDTAQYKACTYVSEKLKGYYQFHRDFHAYLDTALTICPQFAYAYREKSAALIKSGNFIEWKKNIDKAVKYDPYGNLPDRASLRHKFFGDHRGAIHDVDSLLSFWKGDLPSSHNGTYHILAIKALSYKMLGESDSAIEVFETLFTVNKYIEGMYDYLHVGVLYMEIGNLQKAIEYLQKHQAINNLAETHFYLAKAYFAQNKQHMASKHLSDAQQLFYEGYRMSDPYHILSDQIFESDILALEKALHNK